MPRMNGCQFIQALRDRLRHRDTPVVLATSERETSELLREARILNPAVVVSKPWNLKALGFQLQMASSVQFSSYTQVWMEDLWLGKRHPLASRAGKKYDTGAGKRVESAMRRRKRGTLRHRRRHEGP